MRLLDRLCQRPRCTQLRTSYVPALGGFNIEVVGVSNYQPTLWRAALAAGAKHQVVSQRVSVVIIDQVVPAVTGQGASGAIVVKVY